MSLVTGLARLSGQILSSVHMRNFSPLAEVIFEFGFCSPGKFQPGYRDEQCDLSHFVPVSNWAGCSYGKISNLVTEILVFATRLARLLI